MHRILADRAKDKEMKDPIVGLSKELAQAREEGKLKINATKGMFFDDEGAFLAFPSVEKTLASLSPMEKYPYAPTDGGQDYHETVKNWVLGAQREVLESYAYVEVVASAGGTGAISNTFSNFLDAGEAVLIPDIAWVYRNIGKEFGLASETYELFDESARFNIDDFKEKADALAHKQNRLLVVVNDPCHNPTGYTLSDEEWHHIMETINNLAEHVPVTLLHDIAYLDYDIRGHEAARRGFARYKDLHENAMAIISFSASKTFSLYGIRTGGQIGIAKSKEAVRAFSEANQVTSRAKWSNPPRLGISLVKRLLADEGGTEEFKEELSRASALLQSRGEAFMRYAEERGLPMHPYVGGFFVTIPIENPQAISEKLKEKGIFLVAMPGLIRISLSAVSATDIRPLIDAIAQSM